METILALLVMGTTAIGVQWYELMGHISCPNANKEYHWVREVCDVTACSFDDRFLLFTQCDGQKIQCVQFGKEGDCPGEAVVE